MTDREMGQVLMTDQRMRESIDCSRVAHQIEYAQPRTERKMLWEKSSVACKQQVDVHHQVVIGATVTPILYKRFDREKHGANS